VNIAFGGYCWDRLFWASFDDVLIECYTFSDEIYMYNALQNIAFIFLIGITSITPAKTKRPSYPTPWRKNIQSYLPQSNFQIL
jgi:hypothetical protein